MSKKYNYKTGVEKSKAKFRRYLAGMTATLMLVGAGGATALAANSGGGYCVNSSQGCESAAAAGAQCGSGAGSGAFGAFGTYGDVTHDYRGGANGQQTGINNSALCGNRQGNL